MRLVLPAAIAAVLATTSSAFTVNHPSCSTLATPTRRSRAALVERLQASSTSEDDDESARKKDILAQESVNAANLKASAEQLKNWNPQDLDRIIADVDNMPAEQAAQFRAMGMDPEIMKQSMQMMKDNPEMKETMAKMMATMTPEELMEQSQMAQENIKNNLNPPSSRSLDAEIASKVDDEVEEDDDDDDEDEDEENEPIELNPEVLDAMFRVGELMSEPPEGGVTFQAFSSIPPIAILSGNGEDDLSTKELKECWSKGSLGATRVDRKGFERVWEEVQDDFYSDIVEEARDRILIRKKKKSSVVAVTSTAGPVSPANPMANVSPEVLQNQIKNMKDEDLTNMFEQMSNMSPAEEERLKAMGVDPGMMKQSASMMKSNPLLRKAATMMMKNTSPEQLMKASQEAQQKMASMSEEEKKRILDNLK
jgi:hypothetical protein